MIKQSTLPSTERKTKVIGRLLISSYNVRCCCWWRQLPCLLLVTLVAVSAPAHISCRVCSWSHQLPCLLLVVLLDYLQVIPVDYLQVAAVAHPPVIVVDLPYWGCNRILFFYTLYTFIILFYFFLSEVKTKNTLIFFH